MHTTCIYLYTRTDAHVGVHIYTQALQFGSEVIFNLQDRTNRFYIATLQHGQGQYNILVSTTALCTSITAIV